MEKKFALLKTVLKKFKDVGLLDEVILIGSWSMYFYTKYFSKTKYIPSIRTRDIDFLVPLPIRSGKKIDVVAVLKDDGFLVTFDHKGLMKLEHPEIIIEFLVPEKGKGTNRPIKLPKLGVNAQALRFLNLLAQNTITIELDEIKVKVPHPAAFGLHKLIVAERRKSEDKFLKDKSAALSVIDALVKAGEAPQIKEMFENMPSPWRKKVLYVLKNADREDITEILI